jgi:uncharacterized protein YaeQ
MIALKIIKRNRVTLDVINDKLRKYTNMKSIFLQNDKNAKVVDNPKYPEPTIAKLKKTFISTSKSSSSYKADINFTDSDRVYLSNAQINVTQKFLDKYANTELYVFENLHEIFFFIKYSFQSTNF